MQRLWTEEEHDFVVKNVNKMSDREIGNNIDRTRYSIESHRRKHGIKRCKKFIKKLQRDNVPPSGYGADNPNWKGGISKNHYHYKKLQVERYPEMVNARKKVHQALKSGKLKKKPCAICGSEDVQAHHKNYDCPLDVVFLCKKHHHELHELQCKRNGPAPKKINR